MKKNIVLFCSVVLFAPIQAMASIDTASWTNWTSSTTGSFMQNLNTINVTYTGDSNTLGVIYGSYIYDVPSSFTNADITNTPGSNGTLQMQGGSSFVNNFHFSQAVINPLIELFSVGNSNNAASFNFLNGATFSILKEGAGHWGGGSLVQNGNSVIGAEGNGLIQFVGTYSDISFTTPNYEFFYGATVGAPVSAVPVPAAIWMFASGLLGFGFLRRRKDQV
jgi:hypothetical protein